MEAEFQIVEPDYTIKLPPPVAEWRIGGLRVVVTDPKMVPNWFHRKMQALILGIEWELL